VSRPLDVVLGALVRHGCDPRRSGDGWVARCPGPGHEPGDGNRALSVVEAPDGRVLLKCNGTSHSSRPCLQLAPPLEAEEQS
jgi:hypothetical protein